MRLLTAGICLFFLGFAGLRAARVPLTYDEAATYLRYISPDVLSVFDFDVSTNHFLNTLFTKISSLAFGDSEVALRLPNLAGYGMFLAFSLLILRRIAHWAVALAALLLLNLNPYQLDYFALSRGYGLSLGFLMGALYFLLTFVADVRGASAGRQLARALFFMCGAVMANLTLMDVLAALLAIALGAFVIVNVRSPASSATIAGAPEPPTRRRTFRWLPVVAALFTVFVLSRDTGLSGSLYEPVTVRFTGLTDLELDGVSVWRVDVRGRPSRLSHRAGAPVWLIQRTDVANVRLELPVGAAEKIASQSARIEVIVGTHPFWSDRPDGADWQSRDAGSVRVLDSGPSVSLAKSRMPGFQRIMNWRGDAAYAGYLAAYSALVLAILGVLALALKGAGSLAARAGVLRAEQWRPLAAGILWVAALAGAPLYILMRESALYYGGTEGVVRDTVYSLIESSFYGRTYHPAQNQIVFAVVLAIFAAFGVALVLGYRRKTLAPLVPAVCLFAIMMLVAAAEVGEWAMFHTPYLKERTALFLIPVYVLFAVFLCDGLARFGRSTRWWATAALAMAVACSTYHFAATANVTSVRDWPRDINTKEMMADVEATLTAERRVGSHVVLGVDWVFGPVVIFYARKSTVAVIDVVPWERGEDFLYLEDRDHNPALKVIKRYPAAGSMLAQLKE